MPTIRCTPAEQAELEAEALRRGGTVTAALPPILPEPTMVDASVQIVRGVLVALIPCVTRSEANESAWVRKMKRKLSAKRATRETLGARWSLLTTFAAAYHADRALRVRFTRHGGRRLDECNLSTSMKAVEDVVAGALLADDGSPLWQVSYHQVPGGAVGVRCEIEVLL